MPSRQGARKGVLWQANMRFCYNSPTKQAIYSKNRFSRKAGGGVLIRFGYKSSGKSKFIAFLQDFATRRPHYVPRRQHHHASHSAAITPPSRAQGFVPPGRACRPTTSVTQNKVMFAPLVML